MRVATRPAEMEAPKCTEGPSVKLLRLSGGCHNTSTIGKPRSALFRRRMSILPLKLPLPES
jgi:hypothetical protein